MACKNYDITISPIDIAAATGNMDTFLNGRVFVGYTDCYGNSLTISYNAAGTYNNAFCANDQVKITFIYYRADLGLVATNSFDTQDGICTPTPPLCQCITVVDFGGSTPYQYTDCSGLIISTTSPPNPSVFNICGSNPSTSAPKFMKFTIGDTCSDGVNCDIPCLDTCSILFNDFDVIYGYDYTSNISTNLNPYFDIAPIGGSDIAHTITKLWVYDSSMITEYDITLCPFFATFNRNITLPHPLGPGLAVIDDTTLISSYLTNIVQIDISGPSATVTTQFPMPSGRDISGDMVYTYSAPHKLICSYVDNTDTTYITQHDYSTGVVEVDVIVSPTIPAPYGMFMNSGDLYVCNGGGQLYNFGLTPPYNLTYTKTVSNTIGGASQPPICADITIMGPTSTPTPTPTNTPTLTNTQTPTNTQTQTQTPTNTQTQTQTPTNTLTPTQTPSTTPISCGFGLIKTNSEYYYTDCCGNFISGFNNTGDGLQVSFNYNLPRSGVGKLNVPVTTLCLSPTPTPTPTITPTNTATPTITPTNTITPTQSVTPSVTPSNRPVTRLQNDCDVITLFDLGVSCNVIQSPTESNPEGGILSVNVTGGTAPYTFTWNGNGGHNQTLFGIPAGSYEVVVTDYAWPDGGPNGVSDYTATTICVLAGPVPTSTPTMTPTPTQTKPVQCVDLCFIGIAPFGIQNEGPIQFVCDGTQNGRFRWTSDARLDIIWNPINNRWEIYQKYITPLVPYTLGGGIVASTTFDLIPDSAWQVFGGDIDYSITMTRGECPFVIPLQVSVDITNTSCQDLTNCNGSLTILAEDGYPPYLYSIDGGLTYSENYVYNNLCANDYLVNVVDSFNNVYSSGVSIDYDSLPVTYQLTLSAGGFTTSTIDNVSKTINRVVILSVNPPLPVGVSITFNLTSTALRTINSPGVANSSVTWSVTKNGQPVNTVVGPTTIVSQGTRPFCSVNDTQLINTTDYTNSITITNGDVISIMSNTVNTITNGQVSSQTNCTTNIKTEISAAILTPTINGSNCSSVVGSSTQIQTNEFTYVPVVMVTPLNFDVNYTCNSNPTTANVSITNIVGGNTPYQVGSTTFTSQAAALANTSWVNNSTISYEVNSNNLYWVAVKDSTGTILSKSISVVCTTPPTCVDPGFNGGVLVINQQSDGKILAGGAFTSYNVNQAVADLARLNTNGSLDAAFTPSPGFTSGLVNDVAIQSNGKIIAGGSFVSYNGFAQKYLVRLNTDGARDTSFNFGPGITQFNGFVNTIAIQNDGQILVGGDFTDFESNSINPNQQNRIVRLNSTNGSKDPSFVIGSGFGDAVNVIKIQSDGKILVGGGYTTYKSLTQRYLIRLNTDGSKDTTFNVGSNLSSTGLNGQVKSIAIQPDGKILVGGLFTTYFGVSQRFITRLNTDGSLDSSFNIGSGFDNSVESIFVQSDGKILVGGGFTTYKGLSQKYIARLNTDGSLDTTFIINNSFSSAVFDIYVKSDGNIAVGGVFTGYNGNNNALRFATLSPTGQLLVCNCIDC
jgi:uncharacterized delta-60 repeat protein